MWGLQRSKLLVVEPGNMTRYVILLSHLTKGLGDEELKVLALPHGGYIATLVNFRHSPSILFQEASFLATGYVANKLGIGGADALEVARAIAAATDDVKSE